MATQTSRTYLLLEERLGADLRDHVLALRAEGESWNSVAHDLSDRTSVIVTPETLRLWFFSDDKARADQAGVA